MASVSFSEDLTCSVCLTLFTDPVNLPCGDSFCRQCITSALSTSQQCPQCGTDVPTDPERLPTSLILKSLAGKAREAEFKKTAGNGTAEMAELCPEHEEKLKLFCVTDQKLTCIVCRDGETHEGHRFKPVQEAAASLRKELETFVLHVADDISAVQSLADTQKQEITRSKEKSQQLMTQVSNQFQEMLQFLGRREEEMKNELKQKEEEDVEKMATALKDIETALAESRELEANAAAVLQISDTESFLKACIEGTREIFRPRAKQLHVVNSRLCLGPYESHLQFFVWKEMLQMIHPREEQLALKSQSAASTVSGDGRSLIPAYPKIHNLQSASRRGSFRPECDTSALSTTVFSSGKHYWEIDVGWKSFWEAGIQSYFLKYDGGAFMLSYQQHCSGLPFQGRPRKIGIYLNCPDSVLCFYDADAMTLIHSMTLSSMQEPIRAHVNVGTQQDGVPITACWY